jgi:hypothetical protein
VSAGTDSALYAEALDPAAREAVERLGERGFAGDFYLAGGAALALHLGHRSARDLDLMSGVDRLTPSDRRDLLSELLAEESTTRVETARDGYLFVRWPGQVGVRFFWYPYPLVDPLVPAPALAGGPGAQPPVRLGVASLVDLALMKLGAVISRGTRRDFVDLYLATRRLPLADVLAKADEKFGHVGDFALQAYKALADPSEAEDEPMPRLARPLDWGEVAGWAQAEAAAAGRAALGLADTATESGSSGP